MKILVTGGMGFLGKKAIALLSIDHTVFGTYHSIAKENLQKIDIQEYSNVKEIIEKIRPDLILHTAAITDMGYCDKYPEKAFHVNAEGCFNLAEICALNSIRLVYISTDYVFSGDAGPYTETAKPNPISIYGKTKLFGEQIVSEFCEDNLIIRIPLMYGYTDQDDKSTFVKQIIEKLINNQKVSISDYRPKYPLLLDDIIKNIITLVENKEKGIFHFSSKQAVTKLEFAYLIADVFDLDKKRICEGKPKIYSNKPYDVLLINTRNNSLVFNEVYDGLRIMKSQIQRERNDTNRI